MRLLILINLLLLNTFGFTQSSLVADIKPGTDGSSISFSKAANDNLYFSANSDVSSFDLVPFELNTSTGTVTKMVSTTKEVKSGMEFTYFNNAIYFIGFDAIYKSQLWKYTPGGQAERLTSIMVGTDGFAGEGLIVYKNKLYFSGAVAPNEYEIWSYDGINPPAAQTSFGHSLIGFINPIVYNDTIFFKGPQFELWAYDGINPMRVSDLTYNNGDRIIYNNELYFTASEPTYGIQLYKYKGVNHAERITSIKDATTSLSPQGYCVYDNELYFIGVTEADWASLWKYNSVTNIASMVKDFIPGPASTNFGGLATYDSKLFIIADNKLWSYDGSVFTSYSLQPGSNSGSFLYNLLSTSNGLYFIANHPSYGPELWKYPGVLNPSANCNDANIVVSPNPSYGKFKIQFCHDIEKIILTDAIGREETHKGSLDIHTSLKGMLSIRVFTKSNEVYFSKVLIYGN